MHARDLSDRSDDAVDAVVYDVTPRPDGRFVSTTTRLDEYQKRHRRSMRLKRKSAVGAGRFGARRAVAD